jgi:hypothetical protein
VQTSRSIESPPPTRRPEPGTRSARPTTCRSRPQPPRRCAGKRFSATMPKSCNASAPQTVPNTTSPRLWLRLNPSHAFQRVVRGASRSVLAAIARRTSSSANSPQSSCRVPSVDVLPAFAAAADGEPPGLLRITVSPGIADLGRFLILKNIDANFNAGTPTSAAKGELRSLARAAPALPLSDWHQGSCHVFRPRRWQALAATARRSHTRPAAKPVNAGQ